MKKYINLLMGVVCALVSCTIAYADGPVKEGNAIVGHVIEKGSEAGLPYATVLLVETGEGDGEQRLCGRHALCHGGRKYHDG